MGKFIAFLGDNGFTIEGRTELPVAEDVAKRYEAHDRQGPTGQYGDRDMEAILQEGISHKSCAYSRHLGH